MTGCKGFDLVETSPRFSRVQIKRCVGCQSIMQNGCNTARMTLARHTGHNDIAKLDALRGSSLYCQCSCGDACQIVGHTPAVEASVLDCPIEGVSLPTFQIGQRLTVGMGEKQKRTVGRITFQATNDIGALTLRLRPPARKLTNHGHLGRIILGSINNTASPLQTPTHQRLDFHFANLLRRSQSLQEHQSIGSPWIHQGIALAIR